MIINGVKLVSVGNTTALEFFSSIKVQCRCTLSGTTMDQVFYGANYIKDYHRQVNRYLIFSVIGISLLIIIWVFALYTFLVYVQILPSWAAYVGVFGCITMLLMVNSVRYRNAWCHVRSRMPHLTLTETTLTYTNASQSKKQTFAWSEINSVVIKQSSDAAQKNKKENQPLHECILSTAVRGKGTISFTVEHIEQSTIVLEHIASKLPVKAKGRKTLFSFIQELTKITQEVK